MTFFTALYRGKSWAAFALVLALVLSAPAPTKAQPETNSAVPGPGEMTAAATNAPANSAPETNASITITGWMQNPDAAPAPPPVPASASAPAQTSATAPGDLQYATIGWTAVSSPSVIGALLAFASLAGFLLYQCGLTRAKNSGHTSTLLLLGVVFALTGYWIGGFAVQTGGIGDAHAALAQPIPAAEKSALDHELGPVAFGHHWGLMGSAGFFLETDDPINGSIAALFLMQAALMAIAVAAALGATLERGGLRAMTICAFLVGVLIYPVFANWVWGGGWLAELGREFGLGHGFVDLGGAAVVHETAGTLALVLAVVLGPRHGRFGRDKVVKPIPGHNVPFLVLGSIVLLLSWVATNAYASADLSMSPTPPTDATSLAAEMAMADGGLTLAAINTLLAAAGGLVFSFLQAAWQKRPPEPARLCRGLLGGAVASCGSAGLVDPWAAFLIGGVAAFLIQAAVLFLERKRIDDPVSASAVHGVGGAWGVLAIGLFANGAAGYGYNGNNALGGLRGLFFGGGWHQLAAQVLGAVTCFVIVYLLGYACVSIVHKIVGLRVDLKSETGGLDLPEVGALGYQGDAEAEE